MDMKDGVLLFAIAAIALLVLGALLAASILSQRPYSGGSLSYITVMASGTSYATPQNATIYVSMNGTGATAAGATADLSLVLESFNSTALKYIGGNRSLITTQSYTLYRPYNSTNYTAAESVAVTVPHIDSVAPLLGALSEVRNTYIGGVSVMLSPQQIGQLTNNALSIALQNATSQAQALAGGMQVTVRNITVAGPYIFPVAGYGAQGSAEVSAHNPIFYSGRQGITQRITVVYTYSR